MSYTALYRKFRPSDFSEVKGQDHIVTTLKNQIRADRIGHAYLFCGTRGTGKTTVAKIFAKAVNCEHPVDGSPCGECAVCRAIADGTSMNVIEIDAASNNGVDNIRRIREEVAYRPTEGRYKVYIIDEVHMLSIGAFNALLKTLEEPPEYVIFILATTEANKIPITILSRCQRYDFHRISIDTITLRLQELMEEEGVAVEERALRYVAKAGDGSMRDALSLLDQCIAFYLGQELTYDKVLEVLGAVDTEVFTALLECILDQDAAGAIRLLNDLIIEGRDLGQLVTDFTWHLRNLLLLQSTEDMEDVLDISSENLESMKETARQVTPTTLMRYIRIFSDLSNQIRYAAQKRVLIEIAIIRLCRPQMEVSYDAIVDRLEAVEHRLEKGIPAAPATRSAEPYGAEETPAAVSAKPKLPKAVPDDIRQLIQKWRSILAECGGIARQYLNKGVPTLGAQGDLCIVLEDENAYAYLSGDRAGCMTELKRIASERTGREIEISVRLNETGMRTEDVVPDLRELIRFDIEEEE